MGNSCLKIATMAVLLCACAEKSQSTYNPSSLDGGPGSADGGDSDSPGDGDSGDGDAGTTGDGDGGGPGDGDGTTGGGGCRPGQGCFLDGTECDSDADCFNKCNSTTGLCGCMDPTADTDGDGVSDCDDDCPADPGASIAGDCGCPSSPASAGTDCTQLCGGAAACDDAGYCGSASACSPTGGTCTFHNYDTMAGHGYWYCSDTRSQADANAICETVGGGLANVGDMTENDFLDANISGANPWIGGDDRATEGSWRWADGSVFYEDSTSLLYARWNGGEPNNSGDEDCIELLADTGFWNDAKCGDSRAYWCEIP